jgi:hypothetical protein
VAAAERGQGSKGKRLYDWVRVPLYRFGWPANVGFWLLARRSLVASSGVVYDEVGDERLVGS